MKQKFLMGNEAIGLGAVHAGVDLVCGYPGTPSTEILETVAKINDTLQHKIFVEWSVNEKTAVEVAAGACLAGRRALVTMKQVGLNVAADPLLSLAYVGIKGGMVLGCSRRSRADFLSDGTGYADLCLLLQNSRIRPELSGRSL